MPPVTDNACRMPTEADELWMDQVRSEEMYSCHDEYVALIEKKKEKAEAAAVLQK